jgi:hypothetical protein
MLAPLLHCFDRHYSGFRSARATGLVGKKDISIFCSILRVVFRITSLSVQTNRQRPSLHGGTPAVLGQMRGTSTFSTSLSLHTLIIAVTLYQRYTRDVCELILMLLAKNYVGIATLFANVTNNLYCVHNNVALLSHYLEALTTCHTSRKLVSSPKNPLSTREAMISLVPAVMPKTVQSRHADRYFGRR